MSKSKKQKKAEENATRQAKQKGDKPSHSFSTKVGEAMTKASKTNGAESIIGYATRPIGSTIHAITSNGTMLCNKSILLLNDQVYSKASQVTCAKCKRMKVIRDMVALEPKTKEKSKVKVKVKKKTKSIGPIYTETEVKPKARVEAIEIEDPYVTHTQLMAILRSRFNLAGKKMDAKIEKWVTEKVNKVLHARPDFILISKSNGMYTVVHEPSRYVITDNLTLEHAEILLRAFLSIPIDWDGKSSPNKEWLSSVSRAYEKFRIDHNEKQPDGKTSLKVRRESKKSGLSIRRRQEKKPKKESGLKVRRRQKK